VTDLRQLGEAVEPALHAFQEAGVTQRAECPRVDSGLEGLRRAEDAAVLATQATHRLMRSVEEACAHAVWIEIPSLVII